MSQKNHLLKQLLMEKPIIFKTNPSKFNMSCNLFFKRCLCCAFILLTGIQLLAQSILGIDVSHWQSSVNWSQVRGAGKTFAFAKATEGRTGNDATFSTNMINGRNAGVVMGAYHFARPDNNTASVEANHFLDVADAYIGSGYLPPVLDLEDYAGQPALSALYSRTALTAWVQEWMTTVQNATGVAPILYTNANYAGYLNSSLNRYKLWIANPNTSATTAPTNLGMWTTWAFKQYSWNGTVSGISGDTDLNVFNGTTAAFNTLIGAAAALPNLTKQTENLSINGNVANFTIAIKNTGTVQANPSSIGFYASANANFTNPILIGRSLVSSVPANSTSSTISRAINLCNELPNGTYYVGYNIDDLREITESNENDNYFYWQGQSITAVCQQAQPNLTAQMDNMTFNGSVVNFTIAIKNTGTVQANVSSIGFYASTSPNLTAPVLIGRSSIASVPANSTSNTLNRSINLCNELPTGTYYVGYYIDDLREIAESNENDNGHFIWQTLPISISCQLPPGSVQAYLFPNDARAAGAKWRLDNGTPTETNQTITGVSIGTPHTISFVPLAGWIEPSPVTFTLTTSGEHRIFSSPQTEYRPICNYVFSPAAQSFQASGGNGSFLLTPNTPSCAWTVSANCNWVTLGTLSGSGTSTINYTVAANPTTSSRACTITVNGQTYSITQSGTSCNYAFSSAAQSFTATGGSGSVHLTTSSGCTWVATTDCNWVVLANNSGSGSSTISYMILANPTASSRTCTIISSGQSHVITQTAGNTQCDLVTPVITAANCDLRVDAQADCNYQWQRNGNNVGTNSRFFTIAQGGFYTCIVTKNNNATCNKSSRDLYMLFSAGNCVTDVTEIEHLEKFLVYPNPSQGRITLELELAQAKNLELKVYNSIGQEIYSDTKPQVLGKYEQQINLTQAGAGIYFVVMGVDDQKITKRVVIH